MKEATKCHRSVYWFVKNEWHSGNWINAIWKKQTYFALKEAKTAFQYLANLF